MDATSRNVIMAMIADVVATGGAVDWLDESCHDELVGALAIVDGRARLERIVEILEAHVDEKVSRRFVDARPHLVACPHQRPSPPGGSLRCSAGCGHVSGDAASGPLSGRGPRVGAHECGHSSDPGGDGVEGGDHGTGGALLGALRDHDVGGS